MAVGLLIGIEFDPTPADFEELLAKGALKERDFQYVTAELSIEEAHDREQLKDHYIAACVNQNWSEGIKYAEDLKFSDVVVFGKQVVIVEPKGFDEPAPKLGGIIAGIGFTPAQADLNLLTKQIKLQPGWEYVLKNYSKIDASSEIFLTTTYLSTAKQQGWPDLKGSLSIQRREVNGKEFLVLQPSLPGEPADEEKKATQAVPDAPRDKLISLFNREKIDPSGKVILAFAILFEREVAPAVWVGPGDDPYAVEGESTEARQARFLASKIVPGYQPHLIPGHLTMNKDTLAAGRRLKKGESLDVSHINPVLAGMLAALLPDQDLSQCSALSLSGESTALGKTRFAILVGEVAQKRDLVDEGEKTQSEIEDVDVEMPENEDFEQIISDLENPDKEVRQAAIDRLEEIGDQRAIALLMAAFKDNELGVVWGAESALAIIGAPAYEPIVAALNNDEPAIRKGAARTLGKYGDNQAVEPLIAAVKDSDKDVRMSVVTALGLIGDDRAVEPLCKALKDKWDVGVCAAEALCNFDDVRAVKPLIDAIKHEDWSLWRFAAKALGNIGDPRAVPVLNELVKDSNEQISQAAAEALAAIEKNKEADSEVSVPIAPEEDEQDDIASTFTDTLNVGIKNLEKAVIYLDQCDQFEYENLVEAYRIAGTNTKESELREMWSQAQHILPGPDYPGGTEALRKITRDAFVRSIADVKKIVDPSASPTAAVEPIAPIKPVPDVIRPQEKKKRPAWVWVIGVLAFVILGSLVVWFLREPTGDAVEVSNVTVEQVQPEVPGEAAVPIAEVVEPQPEQIIEPQPQATEVEPEQVVSDMDYLERAMAGEFSGSDVTVLVGNTPAEQQVKYFESVQSFERESGIRINFEFIEDFENTLLRKVYAGDAPDVANMPLPSSLAELARPGRVIDVSQFLDEEMLDANYNQSWLDMATMDGPDGSTMAGVWYHAINESMVWYPKAAFKEAGYEVPTTWDELINLTQQIADDGGTAWCISMESGPATGWVATEWIENILLRTISPEDFDRWVAGELSFTSPEIRQAVEIMSNIWFNEDYVYGGTEAILTTSIIDAPDPMFTDPPGCWLHLQAPWIAAYFDGDQEAGIGYDFFTVPAIDPEYGVPVSIAGSMMAMFNDRPEVRALMTYFATGASVEPWVKSPMSIYDWVASGSIISPHNDTDLDLYSFEIARRAAQALSEAEIVRFDGSDLMPPQVAFGSFWTGMTDYVGGEDLSNVLEMIDQSWP